MIAHADRRDQDLTREELLEKYAAFARSIANRWHLQYPQAEFDDLHAEVIHGFLEAAQRFDRSRGYTFGTYASWWALRYLRMYVGNTVARGMHVPSHHGLASLGVVSLSGYGAGDGDRDWDMPQLEPESGFTAGDRWWADVLQVLPDMKDRYIVLAWSHGAKLAEIARELRISREAVRQRRMRAFNRIREKLPRLAEVLG